jgi:hypothetical protein
MFSFNHSPQQFLQLVGIERNFAIAVTIIFFGTKASSRNFPLFVRCGQGLQDSSRRRHATHSIPQVALLIVRSKLYALVLPELKWRNLGTSRPTEALSIW